PRDEERPQRTPPGRCLRHLYLPLRNRTRACVAGGRRSPGLAGAGTSAFWTRTAGTGAAAGRHPAGDRLGTGAAQATPGELAAHRLDHHLAAPLPRQPSRPRHEVKIVTTN